MSIFTSNDNSQIHTIYRCNCGDREHTLEIFSDLEDHKDKTISFTINLSTYQSFWNRVILGLKYIFNIESSKYSNQYDVIYLTTDEVTNLVEKLNNYLDEAYR